jgi:serine/threonine protein kinase
VESASLLNFVGGLFASACWDALDVKFAFQFPSETAVIMSFLDADSFTRSWSFLPIFNELDDDPHRSRNTIAHAQQAYQRSLFRESKFQRSLGEGAVFTVSLYLHNTRGQLYAVKKAKLGHSDKSSNSGKKNSSAGIFAAFKEIQVASHAQLKRHPNVVDSIGWDWADDQAPVVFLEYSAPGSLQQFLLSSTKVGPGVRRNLALDIASGLHGLHSADVAHGDVKLANTLVFPDPCRGWKAKISDFSLQPRNLWHFAKKTVKLPRIRTLQCSGSTETGCDYRFRSTAVLRNIFVRTLSLGNTSPGKALQYLPPTLQTPLLSGTQ